MPALIPCFVLFFFRFLILVSRSRSQPSTATFTTIEYDDSVACRERISEIGVQKYDNQVLSRFKPGPVSDTMALRKVRFEGVGSHCLADYPGGKGSGKTVSADPGRQNLNKRNQQLYLNLYSVE